MIGLQHPTVPDEHKDFPLEGAGCWSNGVVHPRSKDHQDIWLSPKHGQIDAEILDIHDKFSEHHLTCDITRIYPALHG